jgi:hypothetical protein
MHAIEPFDLPAGLKCEGTFTGTRILRDLPQLREPLYYCTPKPKEPVPEVATYVIYDRSTSTMIVYRMGQN